MTLIKIKAKAAKAKLALLDIDGLGMPYIPASKGAKSLEVDVPDSMGYETHAFLERLKDELGGDVSEFVIKKLKYNTKEELFAALSAEQIDAVALAIYNIERRGQGIIIGDQTGIGKGRQAAAIIRYECVNGGIPIFFTEKPNLFSDLYRDLMAIGSSNLKPYIINANETKTKVKDEDGNIIHEPLDSASQKKVLTSGKLPAGFDFVMLTYSQISDSEFNKKTGALISLSPKASLISHLAEGGLVILDESHNASGESNTGKVLRAIVKNAKGALFLSATFAKRPDNMPVYAVKTAISEANLDKDALIEAIEKGGVALQEVISAQLVQHGQMIRRQRTFDGIEVNYITLDQNAQEHRAVSDNITNIVRRIIAFQENFITPEVEQLNKIMAAQQGTVELRKGTKSAGVDSTPYFSKVFQVINQMLFSIKAEAVAERTIQRLKEGKKPVIAFSSTMGSFIEDLTDEEGLPLSVSEKPFNADFATVLIRGLEGVLRYSVRDAEGQVEKKMFNISDFSQGAQDEFNAIADEIRASSSGITISPIDLIKQRIEEAGYKVAEVTGRKFEVKLSWQKQQAAIPQSKASGKSLPISDWAKKMLPPQQLAIVKDYARQDPEGGQDGYFVAKDILEKLEKAQEQFKQPKGDLKKAMPVLHYFFGGSDWYVFDYTAKPDTFFCFAVLNGDWQNAEFGDVSREELFSLKNRYGQGVELDFYYNPKPIEVLEKSVEELNGLGNVSTVNKSFVVGRIFSRKKENTNDAFRKFNNHEVDVLMINQSGSTGASAHAIATKQVPKDKVRQRVMIVLQAELDINTEVQKRGRINRTGQLIKPIYDYVSSAIPAEKRLMMMLQKKLKSLDANIASDQKNSEALLKSDDFLNVYGDTVVSQYLNENPELNEALGDPLSKGDREEESKGGIPLNLSSKVSGRVAVLKVQEQEQFYNEVLERYQDFVALKIMQDEYDLEVETMDLKAKTLEKAVKIVGKGGISPFSDNTYIETCEVNILKKPYTATELENLVKAALQDYETPEKLSAEHVRNHNAFVLEQLKAKKEDVNAKYDALIEDIVSENGYLKLATQQEQAQYVAQRTDALNDARLDTLNKEQEKSENRARTINHFFNFFSVGKKVSYVSDLTVTSQTTSLGVCLGFIINPKARNPYAPSAIKVRFAIASAKKYIELPMSKIVELNAIIGASMQIGNKEYRFFDQTINEWNTRIKSSMKDRGNRYIVTGNLLQAFGSPDLKGRLISFSTHDNKIRKGILLSEAMTDKLSKSNGEPDAISVPIYKARKVIKAMTSTGMIKSDTGLSISRAGEDFSIITSRSRSASGDIYLDQELLAYVEGNNFNTVSAQMRAVVAFENIDSALEVLQRNHSIAVLLSPDQLKMIADEIGQNQFNDEVKLPEPEPIPAEKPDNSAQDKIKIIRLRAKAAKVKLQLLSI